MANAEPKLRKVHLSDTTLRDGEQMPGAALDPEAKVEIATLLAQAGVSSVDAGFPACGSDEIEAIQRIVQADCGIVVSALCRTLISDIDLAWESLSEAPLQKRSVTVFIGTSSLHREYKLRRTVDEIKAMIRHAIEYARRRFDLVCFSPEDASRTEPDVLCALYSEAIDAGASVLGFPDTVGVLTPELVKEQLKRVFDGVPNVARVALAVHFHNDLGLATANTLTALRMGVPIAQCTVNGLGERAGNTAMEELVMAIALHGTAMGLRMDVDPSLLWNLSRRVAQLTGIPVPANKPIVGDNVFCTEAGIHQDGLLKHPDTYLPFRPEVVGASGIRLVLGKHSGRAAFSEKLAAMGYKLNQRQLDRIVDFSKAAPKEAWRNEDTLLASAVAATTEG
ncbi:MAG: hypothetical protein JOZ62_15945 [Acidobacteriaceae bacterium]|nr:hypothetical protein [Acidobacteriaceae bacterium]